MNGRERWLRRETGFHENYLLIPAMKEDKNRLKNITKSVGLWRSGSDHLTSNSILD